MPIADARGIQIYYEDHGHPDDPAMLLVCGYTAQLTNWSDGFIDALVGQGFRVVCFDNRDAGLSEKTQQPSPDVATLLAKVAASDTDFDVPYTLSDMAGDAIALLDVLGIRQTHVAGSSMGGMIVQHLAIEHPSRVLSATSIMSTTGGSGVQPADPEVLAALLAPPPADPEAAVEHAIEVNRLVSGPLWNRAEAEARTRGAIERSFHPTGAPFQMAAIVASGDRTGRLATVDLPFLVIHGRADSLIDVSSGYATAEAVPGADLLVLDAMGHDLPTPLLPQITDAIAGLARRQPFST
ncbi:MAG: pimeloyl-ACP methyl ester carboxylesterase [Acidimicrobiales bacterium]|jgi:pimeloyl-ACP methyl ester carboxylesterase